MSPRKPPVILYSTSRHTWEAWRNGRPEAEAHRLDTLRAHVPDAPEPTAQQYRLAANDGHPVDPTPDQSYCDVARHAACSGYTEDEADPESCMCECHIEGRA